ncbi:SMI1/KNR4 family protein [Solimonas sp. K1W22B-7]|uniref:SMI1/KNR4 family protein n=1 Tax=Solimonas sp. K1W22B-7 TaxID=2303331 RepID=UPI0013C3FEB5|nr:SMI1/KNR4 family protein [Solimonas sp. K1W22B-7]
MERSLGVPLPKSYKDFLLAYHPEDLSPFDVNHGDVGIGFFSIPQVDRFSELFPNLLALYEQVPIESSDTEYFTYGTEQNDVSMRTSYLRNAIVIGKHGTSNYELILLHPQVRTADGEAEAVLRYHSGQFRAPSFAELMRQLSVLHTMPVDQLPPYAQASVFNTCARSFPLENVWWE